MTTMANEAHFHHFSTFLSPHFTCCVLLEAPLRHSAAAALVCMYLCMVSLCLCKKVVVKPMISAVCLCRCHGKNFKRNCSEKTH